VTKDLMLNADVLKFQEFVMHEAVLEIRAEVARQDFQFDDEDRGFDFLSL
jgi:hypothetical protein